MHTRWPSFPTARPRRLRATPALRDLVRETRLAPESFILPLFVHETIEAPNPIASMPGHAQIPLRRIGETARAVADDGVRSVLLFGIPRAKDAAASSAWDPGGVVQQAVRTVRRAAPDLLVITDVCLCEYTDHGHCGVVVRRDNGEFAVDNDATLEILARTAVSHADAGAHIVAPSDMMDGRVGAVRSALDAAGHIDCVIMAYSAKYASALYGPFRDAAESPPQFGDRRTYQMDPANAEEALREVALDIAEGADIVMVKPGLPYLDILRRIRETWPVPLAVYNVSGEYAMLKAAADRGWLDEQAAVMEWMTSFRRAGADMIVTYWARDLARWTTDPGA